MDYFVIFTSDAKKGEKGYHVSKEEMSYFENICMHDVKASEENLPDALHLTDINSFTLDVILKDIREFNMNNGSVSVFSHKVYSVDEMLDVIFACDFLGVRGTYQRAIHHLVSMLLTQSSLTDINRKLLSSA